MPSLNVTLCVLSRNVCNRLHIAPESASEFGGVTVVHSGVLTHTCVMLSPSFLYGFRFVFAVGVAAGFVLFNEQKFESGCSAFSC